MNTRKATSLRSTIATTALKRDVDMSLNSEKEIDPIPASKPPKVASKAETLPKVTLYAHSEVLKAIRMLAVQDGVQAQVILRSAVQEYLEKRGHHFTDLTTGK